MPTCRRRGSPEPITVGHLTVGNKASAIDCSRDGCCIITASRTPECWGESELAGAVRRAWSRAMNVDAISMFGGDLCWLRDGGRQCWCTSYDEALLGSGELDDSMIWRHTRRVPLQR